MKVMEDNDPIHTAGLTYLNEFIAEAEIAINDLRMVRRVEHRYPFDALAAEFLSKAFALAKSIALLLQNDFSEEAYGLGRTLVECALNLRYITSDRSLIQSRSRDFVNFTEADRNLWFYWITQRSETMPVTEDVLRLARERGFKEDGRSAYNHWSGVHPFAQKVSEMMHPLDAADWSLEDKKVQRVGDYYSTSCFVHCSQPALDSYFPYHETMLFIRPSDKNVRNHTARTLVLCHQYLHAIMQYCIYGMNLQIPDTFQCLTNHRFDEALQIYKRVPGRSV